MKNSNLIICALVLFTFVIAGCAGRPEVVRYNGAMLVDEDNSIEVAPVGYHLFWQAPDGYVFDPTSKGNEHIRACVIQAATTKGFNVVGKSRFDKDIASEINSLLVISESGRIGVKVLKNGVSRYTRYHDLTEREEANPCEFYDFLMRSAAVSALSGQTNSANAMSGKLIALTNEPREATRNLQKSSESEEVPESKGIPSFDESSDEEAPEESVNTDLTDLEEETPETETPAEDSDFDEGPETLTNDEPVAGDFEEE